MSSTHSMSYLLQHVSSLLAKQSDQVLQEQLGIGLSQFKILRTLQAEPRTMQSDIASHLGQTEASISRQVKLMLAEGLLQGLKSPKDQREHLMMVTTKGERILAAAFVALERYHRPTYASLNDRQQEQLTSNLAILHDQLCHGAHLDPTQSIVTKRNI
jgi:DNA-binding MarR family transcriptional regulator